MTSKEKIIIVSASFPYGHSEPFLYNEISFLSQYFDIEIFPVIKNRPNDQVNVALPGNVTYNQPFLSSNNSKRLIRSIFNISPIIPHLKDLIKIFQDPRFLGSKMKQWVITTTTFRTFYASEQFKKIKKDDSRLLYFYWAKFPVSLFKNVEKRIFIRVHGGEVDLERNKGYIPLLRYKFIQDNSILYLPISSWTAKQISKVNDVNYQINRLGVYDRGITFDRNIRGDIIRIVSCSSLIKLKRVEIIIESLRLIEQVNIEWVHFGDGPLFEEIGRLAKTLSKNISVCLKGRLSNSKIMEYYQQTYVDLFINVSIYEGVPVSIMEALSFGIPCFATNVGGTSEIINKNNGHLAERNFKRSELTDFIINIKKISKAGNLRSFARLTFEKYCDAVKNYEELNAILNSK